MIKPGVYELDELRFYVAELELHGIAWFSSLTQPHIEGFVQVMFPFIHNYPLTLALMGHIVEESYVAGYNVLKDTRSLATRFSEMEVYAYPLMISRAYYKKILMSMSETDFIFYKPRTRLIIPILTHYNALAPGTTGTTIIISARQLPENLYLRIGVKRYGTWKLSLREVKPKLIVNKGVVNLNAPFNVRDVHSNDLISYSVGLKHYAGDIAISGKARRALEFPVDKREAEVRPIPQFIKV